MNHIEIDYEIITQSAFFIGSGLGIAGYVDRSCLKDSKGFIYFPGATLKGKARYFCRQLLNLPTFQTSIPVCSTIANPEICKTEKPCLICRLFGSSFTEGALHFHDVILKEEYKDIFEKRNVLDMSYQTSFRTNNKINRYTKIAEKGHLFITEISEKDFIFDGKIIADTELVQSEFGNPPVELLLIVSGLKLINHLGGQTSRGLGNCKINVSNIIVDNKNYNIKNILNVDWIAEWEIMSKENKI